MPAPEPPARREQRRYRTGRDVQLNLKVRQEDLDAFYALADDGGQVLGEVFADAVAALERERAARGGGKRLGVAGRYQKASGLPRL